jgi:hypothetical protein
MNDKPYSIFAPNWETTSGGVRVMFGLYGWLLAKGQIAFLNAKFNHNNFIAIYPEIQQGNPAEASTVVRYILNKPGVVSAVYDDGSIKKGPIEFGRKDILYYFSKLFGETDSKHYMFLPILNTHLFKDQKKRRAKKAVFYGKGINQNLHPSGCVQIDRIMAQDQQGLADLLNECEVMYCYDPVTAMTEIARLCGCRVVMFNSVYTKNEFKQYEPGMNGISWGTTEQVPLDTKGFRAHYKLLRAHFSVKLDQFIEDTQST